MSVDRLKVLQMLSDGGIDAETASKLLNGEIDMPAVEPVEDVQEDAEIAVDEIDSAEIKIIKQLKTEEINIEEEEIDGHDDDQTRLHILVTGEPFKIDVDVKLPSKLVRIGSRIRAVIREEMDGTIVDDETLDIEFDTGDQHVRIYSEAIA